MPRNGSGVYTLPAGSVIANGDTSDASDLNTPLADIEADANAPRPIVAGGTGASNVASARTNLGLGAVAQDNVVPVARGGTGATTAEAGAVALGVSGSGNRVINGAMQFWQRGTSFTLSSPSTALTADRWRAGFFGGSFTISRQDVPLGTKFGQNNPKHFLRMAISGQSDAVNHNASLRQQIEDVRSFAGETITVLGWARRASGAGDMAIDVFQSFGTGGSPSPDQFGIGQRVVLATSWQAFACVFNVPDVTSRTLGTNGNDHLAVRFHASAGSIANAQTANLGLQTIGIDLWGVHVRRGTFAASAVNTYVMPEETEELIRCQRFYETGRFRFGSAGVDASGTSATRVYYRTSKRIAGAAVSRIDVALTNSNATNIGNGDLDGFDLNATAVATGSRQEIIGTWISDAEI